MIVELIQDTEQAVRGRRPVADKRLQDPERAARIQRAADSSIQAVAAELIKRDAENHQAAKERKAIADKARRTKKTEQKKGRHLVAVGDGGVTEMPIDNLVIVGHRKRFGNIDTLAESIASDGLIYPIMVVVVGSDHVVLSGERRIKALKALGEKTVRVQVVTDYDTATKRLVAERDDKTAEPMLPSEQMVLCKQLCDGENLLRLRDRKTTGIWNALGFSSWGTFTRVRRVYDATQSEHRELRAFGLELMRRLDAGEMRPTTARDAVVEFETSGNSEVHKGTATSRGQVTAIRNGLLGLEGITTGLETAFNGGFERSYTRAMAAEGAAALAGYSARLNRVARRLRAHGTEE